MKDFDQRNRKYQQTLELSKDKIRQNEMKIIEDTQTV
jgi:hypothetical protein